MGEVLAGPYGGLQRVVREPRRRKLCAVCQKRLELVEDPFCSAACCRQWYGVDIRTAKQVGRPGTRPDALPCYRCGRWKPDSEYSLRKKATTRRGRRERCRSCERELRAGCGRGQGVCSSCGGPRDSDSVVCRACYRAGALT